MPFPHLHLSYPDQVRAGGQSRGRARVNLICAVTGSDGRPAASLVDLSTGGAMLTAKTPIGIKDDHFDQFPGQ